MILARGVLPGTSTSLTTKQTPFNMSNTLMLIGKCSRGPQETMPPADSTCSFETGACGSDSTILVPAMAKLGLVPSGFDCHTL